MKTGEILEDGTIEKGQTDNGWVYKDYTAFEEKSNNICYLPEYGETLEDGYTYHDFLGIAQEFLDDNPEVEGWETQDIAQNLFDLVDWQHPKTLRDEWEIKGSYE
jgi:hypothetical protein